jgi:phosphohistidine swiveling domain-containing protein
MMENKKLFKWGPIDGVPLYVSGFNISFVKMQERMNYSINDLFNYFKYGKVTIILDDEELRKKAIIPFNKIVMDDNKLMNHFSEWEKTVHKIRAFEEIVNNGLSHFDDNKLLRYYEEWHKLHKHFWDYGFLPELANWGGEKIFLDIVKNKWKDNSTEIIEILTSPEKLSFFQNEELEFLSMKFIENENMQDIMIHNHAKNYYWLRNSYAKTNVLPIGYFEIELQKISFEEAKTKTGLITNYPEKVKLQKKLIIDKYNIDKETIKIADRIAYCIWWQDLRKKYIFIANHINSVFAHEIALRENIDYDNLLYFTETEIIDLLKNHNIPNVKERKKAFVLSYENDSLKIIEGQEAEDFFKPYLEEESMDKDYVEGLVVSKGKNSIVKGNVCILKSPSEINKMNENDILISPMTSPDFILAMKKASAIITDEGGLTCHAAIVSRELNIPCIVNTKIATKVFKDNDIVEVDANKGIVRKIK